MPRVGKYLGMGAAVCALLVTFQWARRDASVGGGANIGSVAASAVRPATKSPPPSQAETNAPLSARRVAPDAELESPKEAPAFSAVRRRFGKLRAAALRSASEQAAWTAMLGDAELLRACAARLVAGETTLDHEAAEAGADGALVFAHVSGSQASQGEVERMESVSFLIHALQESKGKAQEQALAAIETVLTTDAITSSQLPRVVRGMIGDRIELYAAWRAAKPTASFESLLDAARGESARHALRTADEYYRNGFRALVR